MRVLPRARLYEVGPHVLVQAVPRQVPWRPVAGAQQHAAGGRQRLHQALGNANNEKKGYRGARPPASLQRATTKLVFIGARRPQTSSHVSGPGGSQGAFECIYI